MDRYTVYYQSGSGGFMFFYSLQIALGYDVGDLLKEQWNIKSFKTWKESETIVAAANEHVRLNGVGLMCNALKILPGDTSLLLYTDIETQEALARLKRAAWYYGQDEIGTRAIGFNPVDSYNAIKDPSWPEVRTVKELGELDNKYRDELINDFNFPEDIGNPEAWSSQSIVNSGKKFRGIMVDRRLVNRDLSNADYNFLLQDVVRTKFRCVCEELGLEHTQEVAQHVDHWVSLHPKNIQEMLYKEI